jgi:hypothetical protein
MALGAKVVDFIVFGFFQIAYQFDLVPSHIGFFIPYKTPDLLFYR